MPARPSTLPRSTPRAPIQQWESRSLSGKRKVADTPVRKPPQRPRTARGRVKQVAKWLLILGLVGGLLVAAGLFYVYKSTDIPDPNEDFETQTSFIYYADGKTELGKFATQNRESIPLKQIPQTMQDAVVAAENRTFWTDKGIDPKGIVRAAFSNVRGNSTQGASTITQQYVKILYLTQERSFERKGKEAVLSLKIQNQLSKSQILEGYLNTIYFGRSAYGVQAAAKAYFDTDAKNLTLRQSAVLASVLNSPTRFDPANGKSSRGALKERYNYVLDGMAEMGTAPANQAEKAARRLPAFPKIEAKSQYGGQKGHMLTLVKQELHALGFTDEEIDGGGLRVTTTFTAKAMRAAEEGVRAGKPEGFGDKELHVGVASVEPGTGALRGFYAGQDYLDSQINWAVSGGMVGSTFKPFTLATALENGYSLQDTFQGNSPFEFPDGLTVNNEGTGPDGLGEDYGEAVNATEALEQSINTAYVDMSNSIPDGPDKILTTANALGVPPTKASRKYPGIPETSRDLESDALVTLGKARISPINMANAYATIDNGGKRANVHVIDKVVDQSGETRWAHKQSTTKALGEDVAADVSYAMQQVVQNGTGRAALALGRPAAGKTGTATNDKGQVSSAWFVGYTPQLATAVMYVRGDGDDQLDGWLPSYFGAAYPAGTWTEVMSRDMEGLEVQEFPPPANVDGEAPVTGHAPITPPPSPTSAATSQPPTTQAPGNSGPTKAPSPTQSQAPSSPPPPPTSSAPPPPPPTSSAPTAPTAPPAPPSGSPSGSANPAGNPSGKPSKSAKPAGQSFAQSFAQRAMLAWKPLWSLGW
jgi:membrane peptidoglycan carboxypeptidase